MINFKIGDIVCLKSGDLFRYYDEFAFRYNTRDFSDVERFTLFVMSTYKRIIYQDL